MQSPGGKSAALKKGHRSENLPVSKLRPVCIAITVMVGDAMIMKAPAVIYIGVQTS
jgi:hypothetical protein